MKRILIVLALVLSIIFAFSGCGGDKEEEGADTSALVIILGNHANAYNRVEAILDDIMNNNRDYFTKAYTRVGDGDEVRFSAKANIAVIVADGDPQIEVLDNYDFKTGYLKESDTERKTLSNIERNNEKLKELLASGKIRAQEEQVDLNTAIREAVIYLNSQTGVTEKNILILDTMLPTKGYVNFTKLDFVNFSGEELYKQVVDAYGSNLPDMTGIKVTVKGALNVCSANEENIKHIRDTKYRESVLSFWELYFGESLANPTLGDMVDVEPGEKMLYIEGSKDSYPYVSPIAVPQIDKDLTQIVFNTAEFQFVGNSDEFVDEAAAHDYIKTTASTALNSILKENPDRIIYVVGSITRDENDFGKDYETHKTSADRARRIARALVEVCNIPQANLRVLDCGTTEFEWRKTPEFDENGKWIPENAAENRVVAILCGGDTSDQYQEIKPYINDKHLISIY